MIYLASPYSDPDLSVREARYDAVCREVGRLMHLGYKIFSPIAHCHGIACLCGLPMDWEYWQSYDTEILRACSELWVLQLDGYAKSSGIIAEVTLATKMGIPVKRLNPGGVPGPVSP